MTQFLRDQASDREEVVTPLMLDGTYLSRNFATLRTVNLTAAVFLSCGGKMWMSGEMTTGPLPRRTRIRSRARSRHVTAAIFFHNPVFNICRYMIVYERYPSRTSSSLINVESAMTMTAPAGKSLGREKNGAVYLLVISLKRIYV